MSFQTSASLKFTVLNPKGRIWTMVAGGGASVIYADTVSFYLSIHISFVWFNKILKSLCRSSLNLHGIKMLLRPPVIGTHKT